jgi:hypothetical protein
MFLEQLLVFNPTSWIYVNMITIEVCVCFGGKGEAQVHAHVRVHMARRMSVLLAIGYINLFAIT